MEQNSRSVQYCNGTDGNGIFLWATIYNIHVYQSYMYIHVCTCMYILYMHMWIIDLLAGCDDGTFGGCAAFCGVEVSRLTPACVGIVLSA